VPNNASDNPEGVEAAREKPAKTRGQVTPPSSAGAAAVVALLLIGVACSAPSATVTRPSIVMPDGVRLAADVILPRPVPAGGVPAVLIQTRYWRSFRLRGVGFANAIPIGPRDDIVKKLVEAGFGVVVIDVRGTGASEGAWPWPWSEDEVADMGCVIDWITQQHWSNGLVGATGLSYEGTTALLTAAAGRPALRAVLAREIEWELADEIVAPGGVGNVGFVGAWDRSVDALDRGEYPELFPGFARFLVRGPSRRDDDHEGIRLAELRRTRVSSGIARRFATVRHGAAPFGPDGPPTDSIGPAGHTRALAATTVAVSLWGSWWDAATADAVLRAHASMPLREAVIGPWAHEGTSNASPLRRRSSERPTVDLDSVVAFFTRHMTTTPIASPPRVSWFVAGAERWETGERWPETTPREWYVGGDSLLEQPRTRAAAKALVVDFSASTGERNRWTSGLARPVDAPDRARARGIASWWSPRLSSSLSVFGAGEFRCRTALDAGEAALHVYVESVDPQGRVRLLTEGTRRLQRADEPGTATDASVRLRPVAFRLEPGWSLRLSVAGADAPTFERVPATGDQRIVFAPEGCVLVLPQVPVQP
jgi:putative CocE/NonD family hydrolase